MIKRRFVIGQMGFVSRCARAFFSVNKAVAVRQLGEEYAPFSTKSEFSAKRRPTYRLLPFSALYLGGVLMYWFNQR